MSRTPDQPPSDTRHSTRHSTRHEASDTQHSTRHQAPDTQRGAPSTQHPAPSTREAWQRNVYAVTATSFMGYTGFTLVMPFLPLFIGQLGVPDPGQIAMWTGVSLGIT